MGIKGRFTEIQRRPVSFTNTPGYEDIVWMDRSTGIIYNRDDFRNDKWLSTNKLELEFAKRGNADGMFLPLMGDLDDSDDSYMTAKDATIVSVYCKSKSGDENKTFHIYVNGSSVFDFSYDDQLYYNNNELDIDVNAEDEIKIYVENDNGNRRVRNTSCKIELCWRYN